MDLGFALDLGWFSNPLSKSSTTVFLQFITNCIQSLQIKGVLSWETILSIKSEYTLTFIFYNYQFIINLKYLLYQSFRLNEKTRYFSILYDDKYPK